MISRQSLSEDWIRSFQKTSFTSIDPILIEKMIMALMLLDNLYHSGLDFTLKGGTCLLLVLGKPHRFSIDVDIVLEINNGLEEALQTILKQGMFHRFEEDQRHTNIPKCHYKFFYNSAIEGRESFILLDVLFEENPYPAYQKVPIRSEFIIIESDPNYIKCPVLECLIGDKLTAFAPNTTGVPYGRNKDLEIIKQLYDIGLLFNVISDLNLVAESFQRIVPRELTYREKYSQSITDVLDDILKTACWIGMRGYGAENDKYAELQSGIRKLSGYVYLEHFTFDSAILCAAKTAFMTTLIRKGIAKISRFDPRDNLANLEIKNPDYSKLNKLKKTGLEAFYYFYRAIEG